MELWLKNGTDQKLSDLRVQNCVMTKMADGFEQQTNDNKVLTNPYVACRDSDGKRWIITAWTNCSNPWGNDKCPCFHSDPKFPDLEPGQTHRLYGWLSFYEGTNIKAEFEKLRNEDLTNGLTGPWTYTERDHSGPQAIKYQKCLDTQGKMFFTDWIPLPEKSPDELTVEYYKK